ncbi:MAG: gamma-glutamyl-gamma-aminobutyrate hydrolase family protein [Oscillibacter sp.]|jgi:putative glutamine amidotransferase|nr:gamma-glutamyl-gamma-aminobutyrate hydrolase family protein [Oscillibacter sp.]
MTPRIFICGSPADFSNYDRAIRALGGLPLFSASPEDAAGCQGLLLPGGGDADPALYGEENRGSHPPDSPRDAAELALIARFVENRAPILGICRGAQMLNIFFGGTLIQDLPDHSQIDGTDLFHPVEAIPGSELSHLYGTDFVVNSAHHQAVGQLGSGLRAVCTARDGVIEGIAHLSLPIWGVQWHPERLVNSLLPEGTAAGQIIFDSFLENCV